MSTLSKKNIALIIVCLAVVAGAYIIRKKPGATVVFNSGTATSSALTGEASENDLLIKEISEIDTDNDGLKDWEESLWKTDSFSADTDGDGTDDGREVSENRDPKVKGPNDTIDKTRYKATNSDGTLTATERLAQESFLRLVESKNTGQKLNPADTQSIIQNIVKAEQSRLEPKVYSQSDILTISEESATALKDFGNALGEIHKRDTPKNLEDSIVLLSMAVRDKDPEIPAKLSLNAAALQTIANDSLALAVPKSAVVVHLKLINALSRVSSIVYSFSKIYDDPVIPVVGLGQYQVAVDQLKDALDGLREYFELRKIVFGKTELAYPLLYPAPLLRRQ